LANFGDSTADADGSGAALGGTSGIDDVTPNGVYGFSRPQPSHPAVTAIGRTAEASTQPKEKRTGVKISGR
jgi:hypothetical protein